MSIKWVLGGVIAALTMTLVLPGIASADHHAEVSANTECDGSFVIDADYHASSSGPFDSSVYIDINGGNWDDAFGDPSNSDPDYVDIPGPYGTTVDQDANYVVDGGDDYFAFDNSTDQPGFFVMNGTYDNAIAAATSITVQASIVDGTGAGIGDMDRVTAGADDDDNPDNDWEKCVIDYCVQGDSNGATDYSFKATPENNCDPTRVCADDESMTVSEFDADALLADGATKGSCTPGDSAPDNAPPPFLEREPITEFVDEAGSEFDVAEVSPAVDIAALPSAGQGDVGGISYTWAAIFAIALAGFGGTTALMARPRK